MKWEVLVCHYKRIWRTTQQTFSFNEQKFEELENIIKNKAHIESS